MASFKEAFRAARILGDKTFEWNGKTYNTNLAKEDSAKNKRRDASNSNAKAMAMADEESAQVTKAKQDKGAAFARAKAAYDNAPKETSAYAKKAMEQNLVGLQDAYEEAPAFKKGGMVRGCGIAKRGFGKAMKGAK